MWTAVYFASGYWSKKYWPTFGTSSANTALLQVGGGTLTDLFVTLTLSYPFSLSKRTD